MSDEQKTNNENLKSNKSNKNILRIVLIGIISLLLLVFFLGIILYFLGFFDTKKDIDKNVVPKTNKKETIVPISKFNINEINPTKLNKLLSNLTKDNIYNKNIEEKEKLENERKILENESKRKEELLKKQQSFLEQEKKNLEKKKSQLEMEKEKIEKLKNENIKLKNALEKQHTTVPISLVKTKKQKNDFLMLINIVKIKGILYKDYLDKITKIDPNVVLCRDKWNNIEIYYGPFNKNQIREELLTKLIKNGFKEAYKVELTQEEYNKSCNY